MILHYIITAYRSIAKYKTQNIIAVLGLSVALFCFSICLYVTRYIYDIDGCFENKDRIVEFSLQNTEMQYMSGVPKDIFQLVKPHLEKDLEAFVQTSYVIDRDYSIEVNGKQLPYTISTIEVDSTYRMVFTPEMVSGSWEMAANTPNAIVLSESYAKKLFGDVHLAIGKQMMLTERTFSSPESTPRNGGIVYTIQAVAKDIAGNNSFSFLKPFEAWVMNDSEGRLREGFQRPGMTGTMLYALLKKDVKMKDFFQNLKDNHFTTNLWGSDWNVCAIPLGKSILESDGLMMTANITAIAGFLILLVGLLNFFHFLTGSYLTRIREYSLRSVNGAHGRHLWSMLSVQSALLILVCGAFTGLFMELSTPALKLNFFQLRFDVEYLTLLKQAGGYLLGLLLLCMLAAWFIVRKIRRITILKGIAGGGGVYGKHRLRNVLLGIQLFICWIFVSLAVTLYLQADKSTKSIFSTLTVEEKEEIFSFPMEFSFMETPAKRTFIEGMRNLPGVKDVLIADIPYTQGVSGNLLYSEKDNQNSAIHIPLYSVTPNFCNFMKIDIIHGKDIEGPTDMLMDATIEKFYQSEMTGKSFYDDRGIHTVVGITEPFVTDCYRKGDVEGYAFLAEDFSYYIGHCYVKCHPGEKEKAEASLRAYFRQQLPESVEVPFHTLMDDIKEIQSFEFKLQGIVGFMALVAIVISLLGIYSAITLDTEYRRKEMAIRKVNGAGLKDIALIFARLYIWLLLITAAVAFPSVWMIHSLIKTSYAIFIDTGILFYGGIFLGITAIIALTVGFRIYMITKVNPAEIIRKE